MAKVKNVGAAFKEGSKLSKDILGEEGLRNSELLKTVIDKRKQNLEGYGKQEMKTFRSDMAKQLFQVERKAAMGLGSVLGGAKGASAAAQQRQLAEAGMMGRAGIERDLFLKQEEAKRAALDKLEGTARFDIGQKGKEVEFETSLGLGLEGIQAQKEATQAQIDALEKQKQKSRKGAAIGTALGAIGGAAFGNPMAGAAVGGSIGSLFD